MHSCDDSFLARIIGWLAFSPVWLACRLIWLCAYLGHPDAESVYRSMYRAGLDVPDIDRFVGVMHIDDEDLPF